MKITLLLVASVVLCLATRSVRAEDLYAITGAGNVESILYRINPANGQVVQTVGDLGTTHVTAIDFSPTTGVLYGHISNSPSQTHLITINPNTAQYAVVGSTGQQVPDMTFRADGTLFAWSKVNTATSNTDDAYRVDVTTAQATLIGEASFPTAQVGLGFAPNGTLYLKNGNALYTVNPATGIPTFLMNLIGPSLENALVFGANGTPFSIDRNGVNSFLTTFDMTTGVITTLGEITLNGQSVSGIAGLAFRPSAVPEPTSLAMLGGATLICYGWWHLQRKRSAGLAVPNRGAVR